MLEWESPWAKWFLGGKINLSYNCLDRHVADLAQEQGRHHLGERARRGPHLTYQQLLTEVCKFANVLKSLGIKSGDRVAIYMGMCPELPIAMLACARIGAVHSVIFGGFSANALVDRITDQEAVAVITQDGSYRRGSEVKLKPAVDEAMERCPTVKHVVVYKRTGSEVAWKEGRDHWWHELMAKASDNCPAEPLDSEHPLYILYTSGTTGKPKGIVHTTGGYSVGTYITTKWVFDLKEDDTFWCTADIGWVTGHSYIVYGPLQNGATVLMYEGAPNWPALRSLLGDHREAQGQHSLHRADRDSHLHQVGRRVAEEARSQQPAPAGHGGRADQSRSLDVVSRGDWRQPLSHRRYLVADRNRRHHDLARFRARWRPSPVRRPVRCPGSPPKSSPAAGERVPLGSGGYLVIKRPWPSMLRTVYGDPERYVRQYWSDIPGMYFTGDGAREDQDGYFWIMGRVDDVLNVSGHRLSTMEIESALVAHGKVAEAAVVGRPDEMKGQAVAAFVTLEMGHRTFAGAERRVAAVGGEGDWLDGQARRHSLHRSTAQDALRAKSCGACCASWPPAAKSKATSRRWKIWA